MWNIIAFSALGFLIGNLVGLTAESTVTALIGLLFALIGGSAISFMHKLSDREKLIASKAISGLSIACLIGVYTGIFVSDNQVLTRKENQSSTRVSVSDRKYVRSKLINRAHAIDQRKANGFLSAEAAYKELYQFVTSKKGLK